MRPLAGVTIQLKNAQGNVVAQTTTNAQGEYEFTNLRPGTYTIVELQPAGYLDGEEHVGSLGGAVTGNDKIGNIVLGTGQNGTHYDFCEHDPSSLSGHVYHDVNNNGIFEAGEVGIAGATVILFDAGGTQVGQVADRTHRVDSTVLEQRDAGRVVAAVLQLLESGDQQVPAGAPAHISDDSAHGGM